MSGKKLMATHHQASVAPLASAVRPTTSIRPRSADPTEVGGNRPVHRNRGCHRPWSAPFASPALRLDRLAAVARELPGAGTPAEWARLPRLCDAPLGSKTRSTGPRVT